MLPLTAALSYEPHGSERLGMAEEGPASPNEPITQRPHDPDGLINRKPASLGTADDAMEPHNSFLSGVDYAVILRVPVVEDGFEVIRVSTHAVEPDVRGTLDGAGIRRELDLRVEAGERASWLVRVEGLDNPPDVLDVCLRHRLLL
jgi:hypothetical protein